MKTCGFVAFMLLLITEPVWAIVTSDTPGSHTTTPGVAAFAVNLDGVVAIAFSPYSEKTLFGTGSLISDRYVLTAAHVVDFDGDSVISPYEIEDVVVSFDLPSGRVERRVTSGTVPRNWNQFPREDDVAVLELAEAAPGEAPRYRLYGGSNEAGQAVVVAGYGATGRGDLGATNSNPDGRKRAGLNRIEVDDADPDSGHIATELYFDFDSGRLENDAFALFGMPADLGFGPDEVSIAPGDSGGPSFLGGAITGIHTGCTGRDLFEELISDVNVRTDSSWGELAVDDRVAYYHDFLMEATGGQAVFVVPEPGLSVLVGSAMVGLSLICYGRRLRLWREAHQRTGLQ